MNELIGARVPRIEDHALLTGGARFVDDIACLDTLHAAFVRSPHPHALIRGVDADAARALAGVVAGDRRAGARGIRGRLFHDIGAYALQDVNIPYNSATTLTGPYVVPALSIDVVAAHTNLPAICWRPPRRIWKSQTAKSVSSARHSRR